MEGYSKTVKNKQKIFIGGAWPYANGSLHLGHIAALLPADILARYFRSKGNPTLFVSGSDCHGTPITLAAEKQKVSSSQIADKYDKEFRRDLKRLGFTYDLYSKTTAPHHAKTVQEIFLKLLENKFIYEKEQELAYCESCSRFLPDSYVEGICPKCGFENARGDQCDNCGALLDIKDLKKPICKICGGEPKWRKSKHFFLKLSHFEDKLKKWVEPQTRWRTNVYKFTLAVIKNGLKDRAITRDIDWGVEVPVKGYENKRIYVWFEAVCGYLSASKKWAEEQDKPDEWKEFWQDGKNEEYKHYYVYGKDNIIFHTIIWPVILMGIGNLNLPTDMISSEYLNLEGRQLSTSRNWAVWLPDFLDNYDADSLRYYLTINGPETTDVNFTWENYVTRNNTELVGNFGNFIHRVLGFTHRNFGGKVPPAKNLSDKDNEFLDKCRSAFDEVGCAIEQGGFRRALKVIFNLVEQGNKYIDAEAPWTTIKTDKASAGTALNVCLQIIFNLPVLIRPFLPFSSQKLGQLFNLKKDDYQWQFREIPKDLTLKEPTTLYQKIDEAIIEKEAAKLGLANKKKVGK